MDIVETYLCEETHEETDAMQSLLNLSENSSATQIRIHKLNEFCKLAETNLEVLKTKVQNLLAARNDALKTRSELLVRQKINDINLNSLFQTRNEFFNYKCDVKTGYIEEQVMLKNRRMKYILFMSSYASNWEAVEGEHIKIPMASEIFLIQAENVTLYDKAMELQSLLKKTEEDYLQEIRNYHKILIDKTVEFAKECQIYYDFLKISQNVRAVTTELEKLLDLQTSQSLKPRTIDILKKCTLEMITENPNRENIENDAFSMNLKEFDMLIPLESLPLEVLEIPYEDNSLIQSSEVFVNVANPENSNSEKNSSLNNSPTFELNNNREESITMEEESNNYDDGCNENSDFPQTKNRENLNIPVNGPVGHSTQNIEILAPSSSCSISQIWNQTTNAMEGETEKKAKKVKEMQNCKSKKIGSWMERGETNLKKKKYSIDGNDFSNSMPPSGGSEKSQLTLANYANNVQDNHAEILAQGTETAAFKEKPVNKEPMFSSGFWNINQASDENDKSEDVNYFSFLTSGDDSKKTKTRMGSRIFTLF